MITDVNKIARKITLRGSLQTFITAFLLVDHYRINDFFLSYAYFRWIDDQIDIHLPSQDQRLLFIQRQADIIERAHLKVQFKDLTLEEGMIVRIINNDGFSESGLKSFVDNMFAIIKFDAYRKGKKISEAELNWYTNTLSKSVTDGIFYFIDNENIAPRNRTNYLLVRGAHIAHLLRDMVDDIREGFINIPTEYLEQNNVDEIDLLSIPIRKWVEKQAILAQNLLVKGKEQIFRQKSLRRKIAGSWYSARFEVVLDAIIRDDFLLRENYPEHRKAYNWLKIAYNSVVLYSKHFSSHLATNIEEDENDYL